MKALSYKLRSVSPERLRHRAAMCAMGVLYIYVGFHALSGSQGLMSWMGSEDRSGRLAASLESMQTRRSQLQSEVDRLSATGLDLDTLDIEARKTLFVASPNEITIWLDPAQP